MPRKSACAVLFLAALSGGPGVGAVSEEPPGFEDYPVPVIEVANPVVNLGTHPIGPRFRTRLRAAVADSGVNFAGRFTVAMWGCGTACQMFAIIDPSTGKIWHQPECFLARGLAYRPDSTLLILDSDPPADWAPQATYYYAWSGSELTLLWPLEEDDRSKRCTGDGAAALQNP